MWFPDTRRDVRWQKLNMFPITILLFICNIVNMTLSSIYFVRYLDYFNIIILSTSAASIIHPFVDILVTPHNKLNPIYVTIISSFYTLFWTAALICSIMSMIYSADGSCTEYPDIYMSPKDFYGSSDSRCAMLISTFLLSLSTLSLYVSALCVGAIALGRFQKVALGRQRIDYNYDVTNYSQTNYHTRGTDLEIFPMTSRMELPGAPTPARKVELSA